MRLRKVWCDRRSRCCETGEDETEEGETKGGETEGGETDEGEIKESVARLRKLKQN